MFTPKIRAFDARIIILTPILALFSLSAGANAKDYYRWTDDKGVIHFTDKPPANVKFESLKATNRASDEKKEAEAEAANALKNPEICKREKARLNILKNNKTIQMKGSDGSLRYLSPEEIKQETKKTEAAVKVFC